MATTARAATRAEASTWGAALELEQGGRGETRAAVLERLRAQLARLRATPLDAGGRLVCGLSELDELCLFQQGRVVELCGEEASGRASLALRLVGGVCRARRLAAWVDGPGELHPPAAEQWEIDLRRLLIVRPRASGKLVWAAMQLVRSGAFALVVLDVTHTGLRLGMLEAKKLIDAARVGGATLLLLTSVAAPAQGVTRLLLEGVAPQPVARHPTRELDAAHPRRVFSPSPVLVPRTPSATEPSTVEPGPADSVDASAGGGPEVRLELVHGGGSRVLRLSRRSLGSPGRGPWATAVWADGLEAPAVARSTSCEVDRGGGVRGRGAGRDGSGGCFGRPGRDGPMRLEAALLAGAAVHGSAVNGGAVNVGASAQGSQSDVSSRAVAAFGLRARR